MKIKCQFKNSAIFFLTFLTLLICFNNIVDAVLLDNGEVPAAPSNLIATAVSYNQIDLTWQDNSDDEDWFAIWRKDPGSADFIPIAGTPSNIPMFTDTNVMPGATYEYRVAAGNQFGGSDYSNTSSAKTPPAPQLPIAPSNLIATAVSYNQINLTWQDNSDNEEGFRIERSLNGTSFSQIATVGINVTNYSNTGLTGNTNYYYRVRAYNAAGNSNYSNTSSATTPPVLQPPAAPSNLAATAVPSYNQIDLTWQDNSGNETGFKIERSLNGMSFSQVASVGVNVTNYNDVGLADNKRYYYRVRAYNAAENSNYSNTSSAMTGVPAAPSNLIATLVSYNKIDLT